MATVTFNIDPCAQLALKACIDAFICLLDGDPAIALQARLAFAATASAELDIDIEGMNACFLAALALAFAAAGKVVPPIPPLPRLPDLAALIPPIPNIVPVPAIPGVTINFTGPVPTSITFEE